MVDFKFNCNCIRIGSMNRLLLQHSAVRPTNKTKSLFKWNIKAIVPEFQIELLSKRIVSIDESNRKTTYCSFGIRFGFGFEVGKTTEIIILKLQITTQCPSISMMIKEWKATGFEYIKLYTISLLTWCLDALMHCTQHSARNSFDIRHLFWFDDSPLMRNQIQNNNFNRIYVSRLECGLGWTKHCAQRAKCTSNDEKIPHNENSSKSWWDLLRLQFENLSINNNFFDRFLYCTIVTIGKRFNGHCCTE